MKQPRSLLLTLSTTSSDEAQELLGEIIYDLTTQNSILFVPLVTIDGDLIRVIGHVTNNSGRRIGDYWRDTSLAIQRVINRVTAEQQLFVGQHLELI